MQIQCCQIIFWFHEYSFSSFVFYSFVFSSLVFFCLFFFSGVWLLWRTMILSQSMNDERWNIFMMNDLFYYRCYCFINQEDESCVTINYAIVLSVFTQYHPCAWVIKTHNDVAVQLHRFNESHDWSSWYSLCTRCGKIITGRMGDDEIIFTELWKLSIRFVEDEWFKLL
jgi:hypothetical protein